MRAAGVSVVELDVTDHAAVGRVLAESDRLDVLVADARMASVGISEAFTVE